VKKSESVFRAVVHIGISTDTRHREEIEFWAYHRAGDRERII